MAVLIIQEPDKVADLFKNCEARESFTMEQILIEFLKGDACNGNFHRPRNEHSEVPVKSWFGEVTLCHLSQCASTSEAIGCTFTTYLSTS